MKAIYLQAKRKLIESGIDFGKNVYALTSEENKLIEQAAKKYKYRISSCGNSSLGGICIVGFICYCKNINNQSLKLSWFALVWKTAKRL